MPYGNYKDVCKVLSEEKKRLELQADVQLEIEELLQRNALEKLRLQRAKQVRVVTATAAAIVTMVAIKKWVSSKQN